MVATLIVVGLVTGLYFFMSRDVYGTIVFHIASAHSGSHGL
jgi:hypothetical protein